MAASWKGQGKKALAAWDSMGCEDVAARVGAVQAPVELAWRVQLLAQPQRHAHQEELEAPGGVGDIGLEQPVEFQQRLVVERDEIQLLGRDPALREAEVHGVLGEVVVVLLAREALFLGRRHDAAESPLRKKRRLFGGAVAEATAFLGC